MGGLEAIDPRYGAIYEQALAVMGADDRVLSVSISGSVATGTADEWSDLDLQVVADADAFDAVVADWPAWLAEITPTVFARTPILPFIINAVTPDGLTVDVVVHKGEAFDYPRSSRYTVGMLSGVQFDDVGDALEYAVAEQMRGLAGPFISLVQRGEHLRHLVGLPHLLGLLTTVFLAELDASPPAKLWNATFTREQLAAVEALPPAGATRDGVVDFGLGVARLVVTRARPQLVARGIDWPEPLALVAAKRVRDCLGIETGDWLH